MLTNTGIAQELINREWHCPYCINRALDAIVINFKKGYFAKNLDHRDVRIFHEVSQSEVGRKATIFMHEIEGHGSVVWAPIDMKWD